MALEKITKVDKVEVVGDFHHVQVRTATIIMEDGVELSRSFHRHVVEPGADTTNEDAFVKDVCKSVHKPDIVAKYRSEIAKQNQPIKENK